jgi:hypothetical protein
MMVVHDKTNIIWYSFYYNNNNSKRHKALLACFHVFLPIRRRVKFRLYLKRPLMIWYTCIFSCWCSTLFYTHQCSVFWYSKFRGSDLIFRITTLSFSDSVSLLSKTDDAPDQYTLKLMTSQFVNATLFVENVDYVTMKTVYSKISTLFIRVFDHLK